MMNGGLIDFLVVLFALLYYGFLVLVYLVRAHDLSARASTKPPEKPSKHQNNP